MHTTLQELQTYYVENKQPHKHRQVGLLIFFFFESEVVTVALDFSLSPFFSCRKTELVVNCTKKLTFNLKAGNACASNLPLLLLVIEKMASGKNLTNYG